MTASLLLLAACVGLDTMPEKDAGASGDDAALTLGALTLDQSEFDFGTVPVGDRGEEVLTLGNTGETPLDVSLDVDQDAFDVSETTLSVSGSKVVLVGFEPDEALDYTGTLTVTVSGGDTLALPLYGWGGDGEDTGTTDTHGTHGTGPEPDVLVSPSRYDFGRVDLGDTVTTSFTVSNQGDDDLLVSDVVSSAGVFTVGGSLSPPQVISPGSNKLLEVSFTPTVATSYTASVTVASTDPDTPSLTIPLEGEGVDLCDICAPVIDVDTGGEPYAISDFASVFGSTDTRTVTIQNIGDQDLDVTDVIVNNDTLSTPGTFTVGGWRGPVTLSAYDTTSFTISFRATSSCVEIAQASFDMNVVHILSNDPTQGDWVIELSGLGL
jgi:hypothetical protein